ncbi:hypothetical protein [Flavobacterium sp. CF136]|uniref:hypothetical protein n=1 Tax=Flavobacterium sp. (strain CF136) TaxID=1144313 RepID=UPI000271855D|nr:hypothetical protein [Flavobacterium sp. CF136]EJL63950.1 hypothetical protein PMI10_02182 [Flavobacterium sp. CF136]
MKKFIKTLLTEIGKLFSKQNKIVTPQKTLTPQQFIQKVLINEVGEIHIKHPYISFAMMSIGIEFLGKTLNTFEDWNESGHSKADFELAINTLNSFKKYRPLLKSHNLWTSLRNGFLHSFVPKNTLSLSSKSERAHMEAVTSTKINLCCEDLYIDFKKACEEVLAMTTYNSKKMSLSLLSVPSDIANSTSYSGTTT